MEAQTVDPSVDAATVSNDINQTTFGNATDNHTHSMKWKRHAKLRNSKALNEKLALLLLRFAGDGELAATSFAVLRGLNARSRPLRDIWAGSAWAPR